MSGVTAPDTSPSTERRGYHNLGRGSQGQASSHWLAPGSFCNSHHTQPPPGFYLDLSIELAAGMLAWPILIHNLKTVVLSIYFCIYHVT